MCDVTGGWIYYKNRNQIEIQADLNVVWFFNKEKMQTDYANCTIKKSLNYIYIYVCSSIAVVLQLWCTWGTRYFLELFIRENVNQKIILILTNLLHR